MKTLSLDRTIAAPREAVFAALLDPTPWWGPPGYSVPPASVVVEPRVGGRYDLDMVDPDGTSYPVRQTITELVEPDLLVLVHVAMPEMGLTDAVETRLALSGATRLVVTGGPYPDAMGEMAERGWAGQLDALAALVTSAR